jgi:hypothetical protein
MPTSSKVNDERLKRLAVSLILITVISVCSATLGYYYSARGYQTSVGNVFSGFLVFFALHFIFLMFYIVLNPLCCKRPSLNNVLIFWFFLTNALFIFMAFLALCDYSLATFCAYIVICTITGSLFVIRNKYVFKHPEAITDPVLILFCFATLGLQLLFFLMMIETASPARIGYLYVNGKNNSEASMDLYTPFNCITPKYYVAPEVNPAIDYSLSKSAITYYGNSLTSDFMMIYSIQLNCGFGFLSVNHTLGEFVFILNQEPSNSTNHVVEYYNDSAGEFVLLLLPIVITIFSYFTYISVTMDYAKFSKNYERIQQEPVTLETPVNEGTPMVEFHYIKSTTGESKQEEDPNDAELKEEITTEKTEESTLVIHEEDDEIKLD